MKIYVFLITFFSLTVGIACLNETGKNLEGEIIELDFFYFFENPTNYPDQNQIDERLSELRSKLAEAPKDSNKDDLYTDISAYMIYNGEYQEAIDYLNKNVKVKNTNYNFCSNIGVAHELVGNLDSALFFTSLGINLNPESHNSSEWIHIKILEAEIALKKDKNWLDKNDIFDFKMSKDSIPTVFPKKLTLDDFCYQLYFQLEERTYFVKAKNQDPVVARLILIMADASTRAFDVKKSIVTYKLAAEYDTSLTSIVDKRIAYLQTPDNGFEPPIYGLENEYTTIEEQNALDETKPKTPKKIIPNLEYYLLGGFFLLIVGLYFMLRKKK